jgi:O-antigen/teichoic acid export membrane protein
LTGLTIVTNELLIPLCGITGAALATFLTCVVSYLFQQWIVMRKVNGNPYTWGTVKQILLICFLLGINELLPAVLANPWLDACYRTAIVGLLCLVMVYKLNISEQVNRLLKKHLRLDKLL